jgi:hypothetical protein
MSTCDVADLSQLDPARFTGGSTFEELLARPKANSDLWNAVYKRAQIDEAAKARVAAITHRQHLLAINEDWCGDSVNILPYVARLAEASPLIDMRIIGRDDNRDLMDAHLTGTSRSIPVVIVYDAQFHETGWWGPRPAPLQQWFITEGLALPKPERYPLIRGWYARDKGRTIVSEILSIIESVDGGA